MTDDRLKELTSRAEKLRTYDAELTASLKGPMSNLERNFVVADRHDIRNELTELANEINSLLGGEQQRKDGE